MWSDALRSVVVLKGPLLFPLSPSLLSFLLHPPSSLLFVYTHALFTPHLTLIPPPHSLHTSIPSHTPSYPLHTHTHILPPHSLHTHPHIPPSHTPSTLPLQTLTSLPHTPSTHLTLPSLTGWKICAQSMMIFRRAVVSLRQNLRLSWSRPREQTKTFSLGCRDWRTRMSH